MALADAYSNVRRFDAEETMEQCAYKQGHGAAAYALGIDRETIKKNPIEAMKYYQDGVKFGNHDSAATLKSLFITGTWSTLKKEEIAALQAIGVAADPERAHRYDVISDALKINPDLKLSRLDQVLPLPPATLPSWNGIEDAVEPPSTAPPTY